MTDNPKEIIVERNTLSQTLQLLDKVIDYERTPNALRKQALDLFDEWSFWMCYSNADGKRREYDIELVPVGFRWPGFYKQMVAEFLMDLPERVVADHPALVQMAKQAAALVDTEGFAYDFRFEGLESLNRVLAQLKSAADDIEEALI